MPWDLASLARVVKASTAAITSAMASIAISTAPA